MRTSLLVARNTLIQSSGRVMSLGISLGIIAIITRYLGAGQFGHLTTINAYLFFVVVFADLGLPVLAARELPLQKDISKYFSSVLSLKLVAASIIFVLGALLIFALPYSQEIKIGTLVAALGFFANSFISLFVAYLQFALNTTRAAILDVANKMVVIFFVLAVTVLGAGLYGIVVSFAAGMIVQALFLLLYIKRDLRLAFNFNIAAWKRHLIQSWPLAITGLLILFYFRADTLILALYRPAYEVGLYGASYRFLEVLVSFPSLLTGLLLPLLAKSFEQQDTSMFARIWQRSFDAMTFIVWPMVFFTVGAAPEILRYLAGEEFVSAAPFLRLLILAAAFIFLGHLTSYTLSAINLQRRMLRYYLTGALAALVCYFIFIPRFGGIGAAVGTLFVEAYIFISTFIVLRKQYPFHLSWRHTIWSGINACIALGVLIAIKPFTFFGAALLSTLLYIVFSFLTGTIDKEILKEFLTKMLPRRKLFQKTKRITYSV